VIVVPSTTVEAAQDDGRVMQLVQKEVQHQCLRSAKEELVHRVAAAVSAPHGRRETPLPRFL
jgi:hypothetical protein